MDQLHIDDAVDFLVRWLARQYGSDPQSVEWPYPAPQVNDRRYDIEIGVAADLFWRQRNVSVRDQTRVEIEPYMRPFLDAAWYLSRIGVLRPGETAHGAGVHGPGSDDGYSITTFGRGWVVAAANRPASDPGRFGQMLERFADRFGEGFQQRASEASACYRAGNYLACCTMAGAAAESILLALAIAKVRDETKVLATYRHSQGRRSLSDKVTGNVSKSIAEPFRTASGLIHYWRDETAHGLASTVSELEAYASLGQLLRFAQLASDHWETLTAT